MSMTAEEVIAILLSKLSCKLNVLVYSKDDTAKNNLLDIMKKVLNCDSYTVYPTVGETLFDGAWKGKTVLIVVEGKVEEYAYCLIDYFLNGGNILDWNSDLLTKIIRNNENSPEEIDAYLKKDYPNNKLNVKVVNLGEGNENPVIKLVDSVNKGTVIHYKGAEKETKNLSKIELSIKNHCIIQKLLKDDGFNVNESHDNFVQYTPAYFLGEYENKMALVYNITKDLDSNGKYVQKIQDLIVQWCLDDIAEETPSKTFLPIYLNGYPDDFSYGEYFTNLTSKRVGKLLIYSEVMTSTMDIAKETLGHGVAIVAKRQIHAKGRGGNDWITPFGQAAITIQLWQRITSTISLVQHASALAVALAIRQGDYEHLDIRIKWPNDVYYGREIKIGGTISTASCMGEDVVINVGTGVNIANEKPTTCLNTIIEQYNQVNGKKLPPISLETFLARYCSEFEKLLDILALDKGAQIFLNQYYRYWLHSEQKVKVKIDEEFVEGVITGLDDAGWLVVKTKGEISTVAPDGNTFDMMHGLVVPKR